MSKELNWNDSHYHQFGLDFGLDGLKNLKEKDYSVSNDARVKEEVLETFVMLHLESITGLPLHFVSRSHMDAFSGGEDLVAWDALGRVHLFELKSGRNQTVNSDVIGQLAQYMMKHLFRPPLDFVEQQWHGGNQVWLQKDILAGYLAGAYLNERVCKFGYDKVTKHLNEEDGHGDWISYDGWEPSKNWWKGQRASVNATAEEKDRLRFLAAVAAAEEKLESSNTSTRPGSFDETANQWRAKRRRPQRPTLRKFKARRPVVMWFIAPNIASSGQEAIIDWRAKGVDARAVCVDLQQYKPDVGYKVRITREDFSARDEIESQLFTHADQEIGGTALHPPRLEFNLYDEKQGSGRQKAHHGQPLENPSAKFAKAEEPNWEFVSRAK